MFLDRHVVAFYVIFYVVFMFTIGGWALWVDASLFLQEVENLKTLYEAHARVYEGVNRASAVNLGPTPFLSGYGKSVLIGVVVMVGVVLLCYFLTGIGGAAGGGTSNEVIGINDNSTTTVTTATTATSTAATSPTVTGSNITRVRVYPNPAIELPSGPMFVGASLADGMVYNAALGVVPSLEVVTQLSSDGVYFWIGALDSRLPNLQDCALAIEDVLRKSLLPEVPLNLVERVVTQYQKEFLSLVLHGSSRVEEAYNLVGTILVQEGLVTY